MNGFSILMFIYCISVFLVGLYMYNGHKFDIVSWKAPYRNLKKDDWKNIGKRTMIVSIFIFLLAVIGLFLDI